MVSELVTFKNRKKKFGETKAHGLKRHATAGEQLKQFNVQK